MLRLNRWIAAVLAACILIHTIPVYAFAEVEESTYTVEATVETTEEPTVETTEEPTVETTEEPTVETTEEPTVETTEEPTAETTEETTVETTEETTVETTEETTVETTEEPTAETTEETTVETTEGTTVEATEETTVETTEETTEETTGEPITDPFALKFLAVEIVGAENSEIMLFAETRGITIGEKYPGAITQRGNDVTLTIGEGQGEILELLSQQTQTADSNYQNWNIKFSFTGTLTLSDAYKGLGDPGFPFQGKFTNQSITIKSPKTIFKALGAQADLYGVKIDWTGAPNIPILAKTLVADGTSRTINMPLSKATAFSPYIEKLTGGTGLITLPALDYSSVGSYSSVQYLGDVGLVCCVMDAGTKLQVGELKLPDPDKVVCNLSGRESENVGGLVGSMGEGAELTLSSSLTLNNILSGKNTGGLVGSMTNASIRLADGVSGVSVSVSTNLTATEAAGGIAGAVTTETGPLGENANVVLQSVQANGAANSGVFYGTCTASGAFNPMTGVSFGEQPVRKVSGDGFCGGLFGTLTLSGNGKCTLSAATITTSLTSSASTTAYGGVAGKLTGARANALVIDQCTITSDIAVGEDKEKYPKYLGGIVAEQDSHITVDAKNSTITLLNPRTPDNSYGVGGLCASVGDNALLKADTMKVVINSFRENQGSSGVAALTGKGAIVYLEHSLDLSDCLLTTCAYSGQIVGKQDCSLIYAPNVEITRLKTTSGTTSYSGVELDDIGNYGELYRLNNFLTVNADYSTSLPKLAAGESGGYTLSSAQDYACFALAWQSRGNFPTVNGITSDKDSWPTLQSSTITLGADINLTDCGIGGLTRDIDSKDDIFKGTLNGGGHKITLAIGQQNSQNGITTGDGRIYWHPAVGLFAALSSNAKVQNLTLAGEIRVSNTRLNGSTTVMKAGALAALVKEEQTSGDSIFTSVSTEVSFDVTTYGDYYLYVGGLIGRISGSKVIITFDSGTILNASITLNYPSVRNGSYCHVGGAIGGIDGSVNATITCSGAALGGKIDSSDTNAPSNLYAGGLVGTILPATNGYTRTIALNTLNINGFILTGSATKRMGGILGGIWADTDVEIGTVNEETREISSGLSVTGTTLTASGAAELGGLVYRASGKWTVRNIDLSDLTINAESAKALGLLVCQGGSYKEPINATTLNTNVDGLYLEMTEHWDTGYQVPAVSKFGNGVFDEFVAYTAYADRTSETPSYQITANGSGIISLKTNNETVNMTEGDRNTYVNRTTVGQSKQTNLYSRYYYNLPEVKKACDGGNIDTAEELLIWSVYRYAASNLKKHFEIDNVTTRTIGGTSAESRADFDMKGLSYYPINITNANVTVQYADIQFYNSDIEAKEDGNKSTRGSSTDHSQHYTMHCGLFLNFTAENITQSAEYKMTVNGVSFAGTVGVVNGGSGTLICGTAAGETSAGNTAICTVILADADEEGKAVSLNGLSVASVAPEGNYTPVLINTIGSYTGLKANYVTTTQTTKAGSSLIGNVGDEGATNVTVTFGGTIDLPMKKGDGQVFTSATLLNSLRYADGSATYTFTSETQKPTHGYELSESVEYAGKCGFYDDDVKGDKPIPFPTGQPDFKSYLPYVANSPATDETNYPLSGKWHELAVNIHSEPITNGCGTYGDPYRVTAKELREAASYLNTGVASSGWQIRVPNNPTTYHNKEDNSGHILLTYTNGGWKKEDNDAYPGDVRKHLQSAYYQLVYAKDENGNPAETTITLNNFPGIGTNPDWAFKGVITGKISDTQNVSVTLSGGSSSFIQYSYGSVVRDLKIVLNQSPTLTRPTWTRGTAEQAPSTFFGGVIGCVLGGDNIIDNVTVTVAQDSKLNVTPSGTNPHLVPVGGYVGVIAGGGVIFRGNCVNSANITGTDAQLYRNPIIGRVLDGYAFYEGSGTAPDNGDKNYTINKITPPKTGDPKDLSWNGSTLTVNNAQGLLILSAIVSSGAGSTSSNAYTKGKARNAAYNTIGELNPDDYDAVLKDSGAVWTNGQTPYLLNKYAEYTGIASICSTTTTGIDVKFANPTFDMTGYDNGYRGLSARYISNAAFVTQGEKNIVDASAVVMRVKTFDGQNANVRNINMDVKEYDNDDFHAASVGGIFNIVWTGSKSGGGGAGSNFAQNLTLTNCNVSLTYWNSSSGNQVNTADGDTLSDADGRYCVSVGGFIGMANDTDAKKDEVAHNYLFTNIHITGTASDPKYQIYGPNGVGGLIGTTAMANTRITGYPGKLLANGNWALFGPNFLNCSYSNIKVTAGMAAGGLIGDVFASETSIVPGFNTLGIPYSSGSFKCYASCTVTQKNLTVGQNSTITARAKGSIAAGIFGGAGMRVGVNNPNVKVETSLNISGTIQPLCLSNVTILVSQENGTFTGANPDKDTNNAYAAGIIGRIGSANPSCFYDINISGGKVASKYATSSRVGGIQGSGYTNSQISVQRCQISSFDISGVYAGGLLGNGKTAPGFSLSVSECKLENCTINGSTYAGGLMGEAASSYYLFNILLKNTSITGRKTGRLFGNASGITAYAAGISVYADKPCTIPATDIGDGTINVGYIAYADYAGTETAVSGQKSPYVTVNPNFMLEGANKLLTGDAVGKIENDTYGSVAARIWADNKTGATDKKNLASYPKVSDIVNDTGKAAPEVSTFQEVQGYTEEEWNGSDLPVLMLKGGNADIIEDYLNVITNGGYSEAKTKAADKVTIDVSVYSYDKNTKKFTKETDAALEQKKEPKSIYYQSGMFHIRSNSFDNTRNRFSLVEVSFSVTLKNEKTPRTYTVSVPVVVIRELQYNFMSTFSYGAEFNADTFQNLRTHVLESTGNPVTAYLTYQYNREKTVYKDYDWQSYMDGGGNMLKVDKVLSFSSGLPSGTQMILLDCQNGNKAYQYTTSGTSTATKTDIRLSEFVAVSDGKPFQSSMAEILGVTRSDPSDSGKYIVETDTSKATVRLKGGNGGYTYYRPLASDETTKAERYDLTVPDLKTKTPEENYYLVITVPNQSDPDFYINGYLSSTLSWTMPSSVTWVHRYDVSDSNKVGENDESTYQISTGYRQTLISTAESGEAINLADGDKKMQVKVQDTITFSNRQVYGDNDKLFLKITTSLQEHTSDPPDVTELQFPAGTTGTVHFYIQDASGSYYTPDGSGWKNDSTKAEAASYDWVSRGANMELLLSEDGINALDLSGVRKRIKGEQNSGDSQIIVTAEMDIVFAGQEVLNATVPASDQNGADTWAQLHYVGQISTQASSLDYSSVRAVAPDNAKYYRAVSYEAVLSMDAASINQLGINPLELVPNYLTSYGGKKASRIDLTAVLDLANLQDIEGVLGSTEAITFTLSLQRRNGENYVDVENPSYYIAFASDAVTLNGNGWSWTIPKNQYYNAGIVTTSIFDGTQFTMPLTAYVFTNQKDYANYKITLTADLQKTNDGDANVVYTFACIKPSFYDPSGS